MQNVNDIQTIGTGLAINARPPVGEEWLLNKFASNVWTGNPAPNNTPRLDVGITDGVLTSWYKRSGQLKGWNHAGPLYLSNGHYGVLRNPAAGGNQNLGYSGVKTREFGNGPAQVISDLVNVLAGGNTVIRPPVGEEWVITGILASEWLGAAPNGLPEITVQITDGVNSATILRSTDAAGQFVETKLYISNAVYLLVTNADGANPNVIGWTGYKLQQYPSGLPNVMSAVGAVGAGGSLNARPANDDEEWDVSAIGSSVWVGVSPDALPDVDILMNDGTLTSLLAQNSDFAFWLSRPDLKIRRSDYMTITDTGGGGGVLGFSAIRTRLRG